MNPRDGPVPREQHGPVDDRERPHHGALELADAGADLDEAYDRGVAVLERAHGVSSP